MEVTNHVWALVLAGGQGNRLAALTSNLHGVVVPKQFCSLQGGPSLLQGALKRAAAIAPTQRICAVVAEQHRRWWTSMLDHLPRDNVVVQPQNRGTAHGLLLPLLSIAARDPEAVVVVLPADHYLREEQIMAVSLRHAAELAQANAESIYLLGIEPDEPDTEFGYIVPGAQGGGHGPMPVLRFTEKPDEIQARALVEQGALWNAFIMAGSVRAMLGLFNESFAPTVSAMQSALGGDMDRVYALLDTVDFSKDVLPGHEAALKVLAVPFCGWTDLGTPKRVESTLRDLQDDETSDGGVGARSGGGVNGGRISVGSGDHGHGHTAGHAFLNLAEQFDRLFRGPAYLPAFESFTAPSASKTL